MLDENGYSASTNTYSIQTKLFAEKVINYWTNFVKFDNPNYLKKPSELDYWSTYLNNATKTFDNYLIFTNENQIKMSTGGYTSHKCEFWKNSGSKMAIFNNKPNAFFAVLIVWLLRFI